MRASPRCPSIAAAAATHCRGTGYKGRIAFHELILITEEIRQLITEGRSAQEITRAASARRLPSAPL